MTSVRLNITDSKVQFFLELIRNFDFVEIEEIDSDEAISDNIRQGWREVQMIEKGTLQAKPIAALLDEL
jgi:hypothetical protein